MTIAENVSDSPFIKNLLKADSQELEDLITQGMIQEEQKDLSPGMESEVVDYRQYQNNINQVFANQNASNQVYFYQNHQQQQQQQQQPFNQNQQQPDYYSFGEAQHLNTVPDLLTVPDNAFDFQVDLPPENTNLRYDQENFKLFIKISSTIAFNASYIPDERNEPMFLRAMILFSEPKNMHLPVSRCANHRKGNDGDICNVLKSVNPKASYHGTEDGQYFKDRLSVVVPIEKRDENGRAFENLGYSFECQSSCSSGINRRPTAIVFTLESLHFVILGKKVIKFKVCSCPKRDAEREKREKLEKGMKRKHERSNSEFPQGKRPMKTSLMAKKIKTEPADTESSDETEQPHTDTVETTILPSLTVATELVPEILKYIHDVHAGKLAEDKSAPDKPYTDMLHSFQKIRKRFQHPKNDQ